MLYGKCKKVLKAINFLCRDTSETSTLDIGVYLHNRIQSEDLIGCLHQLESDRYIKILAEDKLLLSVSPTHKGKHLREYELAEMKHFLFTSILVPIVVSALTTLIGLWITGFFK